MRVMRSQSATRRCSDAGSEVDIEPSATTPLLLSSAATLEHTLPTPTIHHHHKRRHPKYHVVVSLVFASFFSLSIADYLARAPWMRIQEDILCREYYRTTLPNDFGILDPVPEERCKIPDVQGQLAMLRGWDDALECIPSVLTAVPYANLADKYGRKPVPILTLFAALLMLSWHLIVAHFSDYIDLKWYLAGNAFFFIGGGPAILKSVSFTIIADVSPEEHRASLFLFLNAVFVAGGLISVPTSWYLMREGISPFIPMLLALGFVFLSMFILFFLPETLSRTPASAPSDHLSTSRVGLDDEDDSQDWPKKRSTISSITHSLQESRIIFASPMLFTLTISFFVQRLHSNSMSLLFQFASERFSWSLADSSFLMPLNSLANFIILVVVFPGIYSILTSRFGYSAAFKDLLVARGSSLFSILGAVFIAASPIPSLLIISIIIFAFGTGFSSAARSLVTSLVAPDQVSRLYAVLAILETIGTMVAGPLLSVAYSWGLHIGGLWSGMAFVVVAALFSLSCLPIFFLKLPEVEVEDD